jgi:hypothetical protein
MTAVLTDVEVLLQLAMKNHLPARRARLPKIIRNIPARPDEFP